MVRARIDPRDGCERNLHRAGEPLNLCVELLDRHVDAGRGGRIAIASDAGRWTYGDAREAASRFSSALAGLGIAPGERVSILLPDRAELVFAFLGAARAGVVPVPLNTWLPPHELPFYVADSGSRVLVTSAELYERGADLFAGVDVLETIVLVGEGAVAGTRGAQRTVPWSDLVGAATPAGRPAATRASDPAFWLYSSGTTGQPKAVVHRHASAVFSAVQYAEGVLGATADDVFFSAAKLFFAYGLGNALYFPLWVGATAVLFEGRATPAAVYEQIERHRPSLFFAVPTLYATLLEAARSSDPDVSSVRLCISAGEPLPADIERRWRERFALEVLDGIGSTEMAHIFISNAPGDVTSGSTGRPVPGYEARILDDEGAPTPLGEIGNLWVRGASSLIEYHAAPEATRAALRDGWVRTGDKYHVDEHGCYWYAGRSDDMLKVSGAWVSPFEVEAALIEHDDVLEAAVVGVEDTNGLVKPKAFVVLEERRGGRPDLVGELQEFVKQRLAPYKYPRWIEFVDALPKTATGKIRRFRLRELERSRCGPEEASRGVRP